VSKRNTAGHAKPKSRARRLSVTLLALTALAGTAFAVLTKRLSINAVKPEE
jgi:hypothetical protein